MRPSPAERSRRQSDQRQRVRRKSRIYQTKRQAHVDCTVYLPKIPRSDRRERRRGADEDARPVLAHRPGHRLHHRRRHLRPHRRGGRQLRRPRDLPVLRPVRHCLRLRWPLLRRVGGHDPGIRECIHICLCNRRRDICLDHRLGPDTRIWDGRRNGRRRLVRLLGQSARQFRHPHPSTMGGGDRRVSEARRWNIGNRHRQSTVGADRFRPHRLADVRHEGIDAR